ncbi:Glycosyl transferase, group 1 [Winogradskyella psychrotolerans RS-3]|uniref:Glycosyl transferase, group 1 n=1 Tax=Winogradskyella psychrotolerans RS-3 TaxID=641526 RepID=S7XFB2_9FLAO|nr:glycosyltransferase [Winogradskyella psychrotolerans]EPR74683.1 Glycosyl transferase, group 1 [Winogradskyella psychrotolerans RS-3]
MKLAIFTLVQHSNKGGKYYGYAPYVNEMNVWGTYADDIVVVGINKPNNEVDAIDTAYTQKNIRFVPVPNFNILGGVAILKTLIKFPYIFFKCVRVMRKADHIHIRCPSNVGLIACFAQVLFPSKQKSTKYAGNWDPDSNQPWTYRLQQTILRNTFLTRNMKVLVYGDWPGETSNVYPFISATYKDEERVPFSPKNYTEELVFVFAGMLVPGKRPLLTIQFIEQLNQQGIPARLELFGDGPLRSELEMYIAQQKLETCIIMHGNQDKTVVKAALQTAHFNMLLSKSEGWPKAVAEGMFFGCIPVSTAVSCVHWMMGYGERGILVEPHLETAVAEFIKVLNSENLDRMAQQAMDWSQAYTFDRLEEDIQKVLEGTFESRV